MVKFQVPIALLLQIAAISRAQYYDTQRRSSSFNESNHYNHQHQLTKPAYVYSPWGGSKAPLVVYDNSNANFRPWTPPPPHYHSTPSYTTSTTSTTTTRRPILTTISTTTSRSWPRFEAPPPVWPSRNNHQQHHMAGSRGPHYNHQTTSTSRPTPNPRNPHPPHARGNAAGRLTHPSPTLHTHQEPRPQFLAGTHNHPNPVTRLPPPQSTVYPHNFQEHRAHNSFPLPSRTVPNAALDPFANYTNRFKGVKPDLHNHNFTSREFGHRGYFERHNHPGANEKINVQKDFVRPDEHDLRSKALDDSIYNRFQVLCMQMRGRRCDIDGRRDGQLPFKGTG